MFVCFFSSYILLKSNFRIDLFLLQKKNNERKHDDTHTRENDDEKDKQQHTMCAIE